MDLVEFLLTLGCDDLAWADYDADPVGYVNSSELSAQHKELLLAFPARTEDLNRAIATLPGMAALRVAPAPGHGAGNVKHNLMITRTASESAADAKAR